MAGGFGVDHADEKSCRFIHIDASHLYKHVREDTSNARKLIQDDGIVVFDDYRTKHTIGCAAAVWEAVVNDGFKPICLTEWKLYGTWGDAEAAKVEIERRAAREKIYHLDRHEIMGGQTALRMFWHDPKKENG